MSKSRRQALIRLFERGALALVLLDVVVYLAAVRPLGSWAAEEQQRRDLTLRRAREEQILVEHLERVQSEVPAADNQVKSFLRQHIPPRRQGFSQAARLVHRLTDSAGVQVSGVAYKLDSTRDDPLDRLAVEVNVEGSFANLLKFAHAMETASDLVVIRDFSFTSGEGGSVALRLAADLYLAP